MSPASRRQPPLLGGPPSGVLAAEPAPGPVLVSSGTTVTAPSKSAIAAYDDRASRRATSAGDQASGRRRRANARPRPRSHAATLIWTGPGQLAGVLAQ
jgi:hypothetical protein